MRLVVVVVAALQLAAASHVTVDQVQTADHPWESPMVYIARTAAQGFIVDSGRDATHSQRAVTAWRAAMGNVAAPAFVFLTHAHPDHIGGVYVYAATWPGVAIHVASAGVMRECLAWQAQMCNVFKGWSAQQCTFNLTMSLTVATATQLQALRGDEGGSMRIVASSGTTETEYSGSLVYTTSDDEVLAFTGDFVNIRSHLFVSLFFYEATKYPFSDEALCNWAAEVQEFSCGLQPMQMLGDRDGDDDDDDEESRVKLFPGHGPTSDVYYAETQVDLVGVMQEQIAWIREFRRQSFNSCNASRVWNAMIAAFPTYGMTEYLSIGGLSAHVPGDAAALGCACVADGTPNVCGQVPPQCPFLDDPAHNMPVECTLAASLRSVGDRRSGVPRAYKSATIGLAVALGVVTLLTVALIAITASRKPQPALARATSSAAVEQSVINPIGSSK